MDEEDILTLMRQPWTMTASDGDLVPDDVESADGTDPNDPERFRDTDEGGTADHIETVVYEAFGLAPGNVGDARDDSRDTDGDGLPDRLEIVAGFAPDDPGDPTANGAGDDSGNGI